MPRFSPYRLYLQNLADHWIAYSLGILSLLLTSLSEVFLPKFIQWAVDTATQSQKAGQAPAFFIGADQHQTLDRLVLTLLAILFLGWVGRVAWRQILARQTHIAGHKIKSRFWNVLKDQPLSLLDRFSLGDLMNRATADWNKTRFIHGITLVTTFDLIFFSCLSVIAMLMIHVPTTLLCLLIVPFLPWQIIKVSRQEYKLHEVAQQQLSLLSDLIFQAVSTIRLQRATASEGIWTERLREHASEYARKQFQVLKTGWKIFVFGALPTIFGYAVLYSYGIAKVHSGELSLGGFIAIQSYMLLLQTPLFEMGSMISEWQTGFASYKRIAEIFHLEENSPEAPRPLPKSEINALISLHGLNVRFSDERWILRDIELLVQPGERIGFMGPIGSGKSTLVNSIAGLIEDFQGGIQVMGLSIDDCGREWITDHITMVPQKPFLFAGTIRHNLSPSKTLPDEELIEALRCVELWDDIEAFPDGLNCWIGEWGINLSGGQKQRLALARALLKPSPIFIFDDCLSAVDSLTEARILENLDRRLDQEAILWTAHRLSTLHLCNRIYRLQDGHLKTVGCAEQKLSHTLHRRDLHSQPAEV